MVQCFKTLIDCFFDFGQFGSADNASTRKPFSPFAKMLDSCSLSSAQTVTVKSFEPMLNNPTQTTYWVGSGNYDDACFPGNILIWLIDWDHNHPKAAGPQVMSWNDDTEFWKKTVVLGYFKPVYEKFVMAGMEMLKEFVSAYEPNHEDGTYTISEIDASDFLPLKK